MTAWAASAQRSAAAKALEEDDETVGPIVALQEQKKADLPLAPTPPLEPPGVAVLTRIGGTTKSSSGKRG